MWERAMSRLGPWEEVEDSRVPRRVWAAYSKRVRAGERGEGLVIPSMFYLYRYRFCV